MRPGRRWVVGALVLVVLAACGGGGGGGGGGETAATVAPAAEACRVLDGQLTAVQAVPQDLIGLDRAGIDTVLRDDEARLRQLAVADGAVHPEMLTAAADLLAEARPAVVERWGDHDGTELSARAITFQTFRVVPEALVEAGRESAGSWSKVMANADWATFLLADRCHGSSAIPIAAPDARPPADRPPVPLLAVDLNDGTQLVRVEGDGSTTSLGLAGAGFFRPALSADGRTVAGGRGAIRTVATDGSPMASYEGSWECGGWLGDGTLVLGAYLGDGMRFEAAADTPAADTPGAVVPLTGGFCPVPAAAADEVLVQQGRIEREDGWVARQRLDGSIAGEVRLAGCALASPVASPASGRTAFAANCADPVQRGIWVGDTTGDALHHVLTCLCGSPTFSPDGDWLAFAVIPVEGTGGFDARLGFARTDGSGAFRLPAGRLSFPLWPAG